MLFNHGHPMHSTFKSQVYTYSTIYPIQFSSKTKWLARLRSFRHQHQIA